MPMRLFGFGSAWTAFFRTCGRPRGGTFFFRFLGFRRGIRGLLRLGFGARARFFRRTLRLFGGAHLGFFFLTALFLFLARVFLRLALELRFLQLAQRVFAFGIDILAVGHGASFDVSAFLAHFHVHSLAARGALIHRQLADGFALERDLLRRIVFLLALAFAVRTAQEAQQFDLFRAGHDLVRTGELHARAVELREQLVDAHAEHTGELFDGYV